jgi:hypothetical protein
MVPQAKANVAQSEMRHAALRMTGLPVFEDISHPTQGSNKRLLALAIDFSAQAVDMDIDNICIGLDAHAPDHVKNHGAGNNAACVAAKILKKYKFLRSKLQDLPGPGCLAPQQIQFQIKHPQPRRLISRWAVSL